LKDLGQLLVKQMGGRYGQAWGNHNGSSHNDLLFNRADDDREECSFEEGPIDCALRNDGCV
jgi:hypothetical protein